MKFEFTTKVSKFPNFIFNNIVPILDLFRKFTSIRNTIGSRLKRLAAGSVSKRYQTTLFAQRSNAVLNVQKHKFRAYLYIYDSISSKQNN